MSRVMLFVGMVLSAQILSAQPQSSVVRFDHSGLTVEHIPSRYAPETVSIGGIDFVYFTESELALSRPGTVALPTESFFVAIPPGSRPSLKVVSSVLSGVSSARLAPQPVLSVAEDSTNGMVRTFAAQGSYDAGLLEDIRAQISGIFTWRGNRIARIEVRPLGYDPGTGTLTTYSSLTIRVEFSGGSGQLLPGGVTDLRFDGILRSLVVNPDQAAAWRLGTGERAFTGAVQAPDPTRDWFDPSVEHMRIALRQEGLHAVSFEQISATLNAPGPFPNHRLALFHKGKRTPVAVTGPSDGECNPGDSVVFYGRSPAKEDYSDTSVYWLSVNEDSAAGAPVDSVVNPSAADTVRGFRHQILLEKDSIYFFGNGGLPANNNTGEAQGEGWYWRRLFVNQSTSFSFLLQNPDTSAVPLRVAGRFHSPVQNQAEPTHNLQIRVNGSLVGSVVFNQNRDTVFQMDFPPSLVFPGVNTVSIQSVPTAASLNEVYFDWLRVEVKETLTAVSDTLLFEPDPVLAGSVALFPIKGFTGPQVTVFRLGTEGDIEKTFSGSLTGAGPFTFTFSDTVLSGRTYYAAGAGRSLAPPSVERKQFPDLRSNSAGADYVIITHRDLASAANQLSAYRSGQGIGRTAVVYVDDIYDEFNFGHQSPVALRSFLNAADSLWPDPDPAYVVLLGDANWDARNNLGSPRRNLVPSFGNPVSDAWYVASQADGLLPERCIGRIPVQTLQQASAFVSHIISYEAQEPGTWNKTFLFMAAGYTPLEAQRFQGFSDTMVDLYVESAPVSGLASRLYRPPSNVIEFEMTDSIRKIIEDGALWMNFYGHAGTEIWANGISQPDQLANTSGKRHLVSDISCSTVRFAEPAIEAFGERMVLGEEGGAIAYIGSSGFGYESPLRVLAQEMYRTVAEDTLRELGQILFAAKVRLLQTGTSLLNRQALDQFTLLGDPATRLALATRPDYAIEPGSVVVVPEGATESDSLQILIPVVNYGLAGPDTVVVSLSHTFQSSTQPLPSAILPPVGLSDTLVISSPSFNQAGSHSIRIAIDPDMRLSEVSRANNELAAPFFVLSRQLLPLWPPPYSANHRDSILLILQNPNQPQAAAWNAVFELDTASGFSSPALVKSPARVQGTFSTEWQVPPGTLLNHAMYYWRGRLFSGGDSTNWVEGVFWTRDQLRDTWRQEGRLLITGNTTKNIMGDDQARLYSDSKHIVLYSAGFDAGDSASMYIDGVNISLGLTERGYNVAVLDPGSAAVEQFAAFRTYSNPTDTMLVEPLIQFLNAIPQGKIVLMAIADEGAVNKTGRLNRAIESVGSGMIRSLGFRSSWALIGRKGAAPGTVPEVLRAATAGPAAVEDTVLFAARDGSLTTHFIGPAAAWTQVSIESDTSGAGTHASFDLIRRHTFGVTDTIFGIPAGSTLLSPLVTSTVRDVALRANLWSDSTGLSPVLTGWSLTYAPSAEIGINYQTVTADKDTVLEGDVVALNVGIRNVSPSGVTNAGVRVSTRGFTIDSANVDIPPFGAAAALFSVNTAGMGGRVDLSVEVDAGGEIPEAFESNNIYSIVLEVSSDTVAPVFQVFFDGREIFDNDYIRPTPEIRITINDNSPLPLTDPGSVVLSLDGRQIGLGTDPDSLFETLPGPEKARVTFRPSMQKGPHALSVQVLDATGNPADSMEYMVRFNVETDLRVLNVLNFPNPFSAATAFTFHLTGTGAPDEAILKVYTIGGRLIYERRLHPGEIRVGFNTISWDGRDQNGDPVANGVYFYKIIAVQGGKKAEVTEKLARVR